MPSPIAAARDSGLSLPAVDALVSWEPLAMYWVATRPTGVLEESSISFLVIAPSATVLFGTETKARSLAEISSPARMVFVAATTSVVPENASAIRLLASISDTTATPPAMTAMTARPAVTFCRRETFTAIFSMPVRLVALGDAAPRRPAALFWAFAALASSLAFFFSALRSARDGFDGFAGFSRFFFGSCSSAGSESVKKLEDSISLTGMYLSISCGGLYGRGEA